MSDFGKPGNPLDLHHDRVFEGAIVPKCGKPARRETDTFDTFVPTRSWYFARFTFAPTHPTLPFGHRGDVDYWLPVDQYIGGVEHAVLHLLYSRFYSACHDRDVRLSAAGHRRSRLPRLFTQGMVIHETYRSDDGRWLLPTEVRFEGEGDDRTAFEIASGKPAIIGSIEKMSKSKKNLVDPDDIITTYGADCVRWFILSDSPPERDVIFTEAGVAGASRFMQRVWRLLDTIDEKAASKDAPAPGSFGATATALRKATHKTIQQVSENIEALRFNVAVAHLYEFANAAQAAAGEADQGLDWALREAIEALVQLIAPFMPHLAEEGWARLGYNTLVAEQPWPEADPALVVDDTITIAVQVNGKRRDELTIDRAASKDDVETAALKLDAVVRALDGKAPKKVIVVPQRIVNVVA